MFSRSPPSHGEWIYLNSQYSFHCEDGESLGSFIRRIKGFLSSGSL